MDIGYWTMAMLLMKKMIYALAYPNPYLSLITPSQSNVRVGGSISLTNDGTRDR